MTRPFLFLFLVLTSHRITRLITTDDFPFRPVRDLLSRHTNTWLTRWLDALVTCPFCASFHVSGWLVLVTDLWLVPLSLPVLWWGAVAGLTSILFSATTRLDD